MQRFESLQSITELISKISRDVQKYLQKFGIRKIAHLRVARLILMEKIENILQKVTLVWDSCNNDRVSFNG